ncbi:MAG: 2-oxoacid:acceptor oxidoreductase family protein [Clostridiales Family XIII bacterium]|jgi:2-oxoglutarate ferredoxin oxidoreductase subunit gamma|nr:2-oxoacid:acceptor oxidoreductase family protein [Clostridiales Family XIII bacterium]
MAKEVVFAGFGGQGVLTAGYMFAEILLKVGFNLTYMPAYGAEMRGGAANCTVKFGDGKIGSPLMKDVNLLVAMNGPATDAFEKLVVPGGTMLVNSDIVDRKIFRSDITVVPIPFNTLAREEGNDRGANIVMLGAVVKYTGITDVETAADIMRGYFDEKGKSKYNDANTRTLHRGYES